MNPNLLALIAVISTCITTVLVLYGLALWRSKRQIPPKISDIERLWIKLPKRIYILNDISKKDLSFRWSDITNGEAIVTSTTGIRIRENDQIYYKVGKYFYKFWVKGLINTEHPNIPFTIQQLTLRFIGGIPYENKSRRKAKEDSKYITSL